MLTHVKNTLERYDFPIECRTSILETCRLLLDNGVDQLLAVYDDNYDCDVSGICYKAKLIADKIGINQHLACLAFYLMLTKRLKQYYIKRNLPLDCYDGVICDLKHKNEECMLAQGVWGTFVSGWFVGFFKMQRFCLGRLQFELMPFKQLFPKVVTSAIDIDTKVINVHIPRDGQRLERALLDEAYVKAKDFYADQLDGKPTVFTCESWLLYPKNLEVLSQESNVRNFISDYQIIHHGTYPDYKELWRLFDVNYDGNPDNLPQDTSLRRAYASWVKQGLPTGYGLGIYFYDDKQ